MKTINVIAQAISNGLSNNEMILLPNASECTFKEYVGDLSFSGKYGADDKVPAGLFIYGIDNFIGTPDVIGADIINQQDVGFYELRS